ncbi:DJ-1/PfpI family protein [Marinobacter sp. 71-i]|uniref:DJ-1/PfpI family protein n=1 Tax=Marinobacter iranensis TaxID=2962607 RepID=A0ABT5YB74_9GAMM|nr:DJ-1/PfpI family protein [Marinobacter iranensis]MDF0750928.1 DJ-1/PfpI family protein [Marinobacter iranensis]
MGLPDGYNGPDNCFIIGQSESPITCARGLSINPQVSFDACPKLDYLLVPGGQGTRKEVENHTLVEFVESQARGCQAVLSVCTGSFVLHAAGLLANKRATTHWASLDRLKALEQVEVVEERFVRDGNIWTSAGISAGIDLMFAFIASIAGDEVAGQVQFSAEYYPAATNYGGFEKHPSAPMYLKRS